jgi:hypothetical protein
VATSANNGADAEADDGGRLSRARRRLAGMASRAWRTGPRRAALLVAIAVWAASSVWFFTGRGGHGKTAQLAADAWYYHAYLPSLFLDGDLDFTNEYQVTRNWYRFGKAPTGRPSNVFGIGPAVFEAPVFLAGHAVARAAAERSDGFSEPEVIPPLYLSLLFSLAALVPAGMLLRRRLGARYGSISVPILLAAAGPVVYYAIRQPGYAHPFATFWVALLVERWDASYDRPRALRTWLVLGALLGAAALARPQCGLWGFLLIAAAVDDVLRVRREEGWTRLVLRRLAPRWLAAAGMTLLVFAPQLVAWRSVYGEWLTTPQGEGFMWWGDSAWTETLFSSRNGLFPWSPLYALAAIGLLVAIARVPRLGLARVAGVLLQAWINGAVWDWWAGGSYGGRRFDSTYVAFSVGLGAVLIRPFAVRPARRWLARGVAAAGYTTAVLLAAGNLVFAGSQSSPTVRIHGGAAAAGLLEKEIGSRLGRVVGKASSLANAPARAIFAWRHGTGADVYDKVVGVHQLGELYPGLNSVRGKNTARVKLADPRSPRLVGLVAGPIAKTTAMGGDSATILVGFNRRDRISFRLRAAAGGSDPASVELRLNGEPLARGSAGSSPTDIAGQGEPRRGVNRVEVRAPAGTVLHVLELQGTGDPLGEP